MRKLWLHPLWMLITLWNHNSRPNRVQSPKTMAKFRILVQYWCFPSSMRTKVTSRHHTLTHKQMPDLEMPEKEQSKYFRASRGINRNETADPCDVEVYAGGNLGRFLPNRKNAISVLPRPVLDDCDCVSASDSAVEKSERNSECYRHRKR